MKRIGFLWEKFCTLENAKMAITLGTKNKRNDRAVKRKLGYTRPYCYELNPKKVDKYARKLVKVLSEDAWEPKMPKHITKPSANGKMREIDCPCLFDHFVHWMLILTIKEPIMRGMYEHSCGSIPGKGIHYAKKKIENWVRNDKQSKYFVKLDIKKFYSSIDHNLLKATFRRLIKDIRILNIIDKSIDTLPTGILIGGYTSPWFANYFLQALDHSVKNDYYKIRRGKRYPAVRHYLRYMDDMLLIGPSKRELEKAVNGIIIYAKAKLGLTIKPTWEIKKVAETECGKIKSGYVLDIVGYRFYKDHTEVRKRIFLQTRRLVKSIHCDYRKCRAISANKATSLVSRLAWFKHADSRNFNQTSITPYITIKKLTEVISHETKNKLQRAAEPCRC